MKPTKKKFLSVDVGVIASLGRESIKDHTTAVLELVKNSYDAGAKIVDVEIMSHLHEPYIRIADDGCGMTEKDVDENWLRIGYSGKRKDKYVEERRRTGEKGIGRISADRLGAIMEMRSRTPADGDIGITIDWNDFNQMGVNLEKVEIDFYDENVQTTIPKRNINAPEPVSGTELVIRELRQKWINKDLDDLYKQLSMLISPFDTKVDFDIRLRSGEEESREQVRVSEISKYFEVKLDATFHPSKNIVAYNLWERVPGSGERVKKQKLKIPLNQLITDPEISLDKELGPIRVVLFYYPLNKTLILGSKHKLSELSDYLKNNAGIKLYRDSIRVKPYGEMDRPGGDWLDLGFRFAQNPAGRSRKDHRIRPSQLVGALFISRDDNPDLSDSASREGLIQYDGFRLLYELVRGCIRLIEASSHKIFTQEKDLSDADDEAIDRDLETVNKKLDLIRNDLQDVSKTLSQNDDTKVKAIGETVAALVSRITYATESIELLESQTRLYRGLATIGIASAVFGHETLLQIARMLSAVTLARDYLQQSPPEVKKSLSKINMAISSSQDVKAWGGFALDRIRRDKRERKKESVGQIINQIETELKGAFDAVGIAVDDKEIDNSIKSSVFKIDIESIVLNLFTNAYTACKQKPKNRNIKIILRETILKERKGFSLIVSDTGPGVNENLRSIIWEPAFTTKTTKNGASEEGTGMGLAIVDGIVDEMYGSRKVDSDPELGGARFEIWLPIIS